MSLAVESSVAAIFEDSLCVDVSSASPLSSMNFGQNFT
jgi:hypothetical protein